MKEIIETTILVLVALALLPLVAAMWAVFIDVIRFIRNK